MVFLWFSYGFPMVTKLLKCLTDFNEFGQRLATIFSAGVDEKMETYETTCLVKGW